ncbi:MAG TPA: nuclear transport factor 2 family protein [Solirubrobacterales bacterium]
MSQQPMDSAILAHFEAFNRRDWTAIGANVSPEVVLAEAPGLTPDLRTYKGWDEVRAYFEGLYRFWEQVHIEVRRIAWANASLAAVTIRATLTGRGSGVEVAADGGHLFEFRDGRVVRMTMYRSPEEALEAAGLRE